jgi:hypothetical protein
MIFPAHVPARLAALIAGAAGAIAEVESVFVVSVAELSLFPHAEIAKTIAAAVTAFLIMI